MAIKCPTIDLHLLTLKKFQEAFSNEDFLHSVLTDRYTETATILSPLFQGIWSFENYETPELQAVIQRAL